MNPAVQAVLTQHLKTLKLSTMEKELEGQIRQAHEAACGYDEFLLNLVEAEVQIRQENGRKRRLKEARFPMQKPLETFDFEAAPDLDARLIKELSTGTFIKEARNIILIGKSGAGKTHLATSIGMEACRYGHRVRFITGCGLANELTEAREQQALGRMIKRYAGYGLLILDELGYVPFSKIGAELLFQVLTERHERRSIIITTNLGFGDWTQVFGDANLTAALLDRVTHRAHIIQCNWDSYRLKQTLKSRG
ncbi:IS21-like element helper ATPase IstB [uncultured Desulfobacter sp.]|uniref:IS21-like element helper ATPase IstB n=2 Tax=uncultured Desulfobacter sp. TaxID=240139 RepID=UPI0029F5918D|nr:IS21-like element helper ATPase IstB [uncultured Desulfobacter sp.]